MKVMVVDDERDVELLFRQKFRREIKKGQIEFDFAFSANDALNKLEDVHADVILILSDINMPGMSGLELLKKSKDKFPSLKVFMITAYNDEENYKKAVEFGTDDYINKPIDFETLKTKIFSLENTEDA